MPKIIDQIVSQHAEESSFLWLLRDAAVREPHYTLNDLKDLEERIDGHLDGLRVAGDMAWTFCEDGLQYMEPGEIFAAAYTALDNSRQDWLDQTLEVVAHSPHCLRGLVSAFGWQLKEKLQDHVFNWLKSDDPLHRQIGLSACAIQRVDCGDYIRSGLEDTDPAVRARALRSVGELRRSDLHAAVVEQLTSADVSCRFWAAWSATLLGNTNGLSVLLGFTETEGDFQHRALALALRAMDKSSAVEWVRDHLKRSEYERIIIEATGIVGDPVAIPWLISSMKKPAVSRLAGEAFSMITGLDLAYESMDMDQPADFESRPTEDPEDNDVTMDPDEELPWPDQQLIAKWWANNQGGFTAADRYLCGHPIKRDQCLKVLKTGFQHQRRAAALELALLDRDEPLFNCSATAKRQSQLLKTC
jgi:uncharacterized protein (TIGR02270 family)